MALAINGTTGISGVDGSASAPALQGTDSNTGVSFGTDTVNINTGGSTRATVDSSGKLGIGTSSPSATLHCSSSSNTGIFAQTTNSGSSASTNYQTPNRIFFTGIDIGGTNSSYTIYDGTAGAERMRVTSAGHFLFSCTNPDDSTETGIKLYESNNIPYITNTIDSSSANHSFYHLYNKNASNNGYRFFVKQDGGIGNHSGNNSNLSDEREKKNITLMGSVYNTFKQFVFKDFNYISENDSVTKKHGLIAQDVESIDSDLVSEDFKASVDSEGNDVLRKGLKEEQFMMIGFKTLQETITKLEAAEAKITTLETKVAALEAG